MKILLFGAGRSSLYFIEYLLKQCEKYTWELSIADVHFDNLSLSIRSNPKLTLVELNIEDHRLREQLIHAHDFVVSLLPVQFHFTIASDCLKFSKPFANASYITDELKSLEPEILSKGLLFQMR